MIVEGGKNGDDVKGQNRPFVDRDSIETLGQRWAPRATKYQRKRLSRCGVPTRKFPPIDRRQYQAKIGAGRAKRLSNKDIESLGGELTNFVHGCWIPLGRDQDGILTSAYRPRTTPLTRE